MSSPSEQESTGDSSQGPVQAGPAATEYPQVPPPPAAAAAAVSQRLPVATLGVWALGSVRPLVLLLIAGSFNLFVAMAFVVVAAVSAVLRWLRFEWRLESDALVIEQGVIQRQRRVIPLDRIQSVEAVRKLGHRVFGVVELRVESIGGGSTEGQLDALDPSVARQLRTELLRKGADRGAEPASETEQGGPEGASAPASAPALVRMTPRQLVIAGITGGRVGVFAAILGFASQAAGERVDVAVEWVMTFVGGTEATGVLTAALVFAAMAFAVAFLLSVAATTLTFWDFTLTKDRRNLYTSRGLLDQRSGTIPLHRVQSVRVEENAVRRAFGLAAVKVEVAGHVGGNSGQETSTVLPLGRRKEALRLAGTIVERPDVEDVTLQRMPVGARDRRFVRAAATALVLTAPATWWFGAPGLVALALAVPFGGLALASYRALGHAEPDGLILARSGVLVRTTHVTSERALQAVGVNSTPFQRRRGLATLSLHIARSPGGGGDPEIIDIKAEGAHAELQRLAVASDACARRPRAQAGPAVRAATSADQPAIEAVRASVGDAVPRSGAEADSGLSLVVDDDGEVVGHAFTTAVDVEERQVDQRVHLLAPVAVREDRQGEGLDELLVRASLTAAAQQGAHRLVAVGPRDLYERFGFEPVEAQGLEAPGSSNGSWLVRLLPADDGSATGTLSVPGAWSSE